VQAARTCWQIYGFALSVGLSSAVSGSRGIGLKQLVMPVGYWRFPVFGLTAEALNDLPAGSRVLDIGSPKLLSLYLALVKGFEVWATDLQDAAIERRYQRHYRDYRFARHCLGRYHVEYQDGRNLPYADESFDSVYSLSVVEHIPDGGDSACCAEIGRVLRPGGAAVIEVPFAPQARDTYVAHSVYGRGSQGEPVFYQRHYDPTTVWDRLIRPSGLALRTAYICRERFAFGDRWQKMPLPVRGPLLWAEAYMSRCNHAVVEVGAAFEARPASGAMNITLLLEKVGRPEEEQA
jgi:SAM-dependent methyltransferase